MPIAYIRLKANFGGLIFRWGLTFGGAYNLRWFCVINLLPLSLITKLFPPIIRNQKKERKNIANEQIFTFKILHLYQFIVP